MIRITKDRHPIRIDGKIDAIWVATSAPTTRPVLGRFLDIVMRRSPLADFEGKPWPKYYCFGYPASDSMVYRIADDVKLNSFGWNPTSFVGTIVGAGSDRVLKKWHRSFQRIGPDEGRLLNERGVRFYSVQVNTAFGTFFEDEADLVMAKMILSD